MGVSEGTGTERAQSHHCTDPVRGSEPLAARGIVVWQRDAVCCWHAKVSRREGRVAQPGAWWVLQSSSVKVHGGNSCGPQPALSAARLLVGTAARP